MAAGTVRPSGAGRCPAWSCVGASPGSWDSNIGDGSSAKGRGSDVLPEGRTSGFGPTPERGPSRKVGHPSVTPGVRRATPRRRLRPRGGQVAQRLGCTRQCPADRRRCRGAGSSVCTLQACAAPTAACPLASLLPVLSRSGTPGSPGRCGPSWAAGLRRTPGPMMRNRIERCRLRLPVGPWRPGAGVCGSASRHRDITLARNRVVLVTRAQRPRRAWRATDHAPAIGDAARTAAVGAAQQRLCCHQALQSSACHLVCCGSPPSLCIGCHGAAGGLAPVHGTVITCLARS